MDALGGGGEDVKHHLSLDHGNKCCEWSASSPGSPLPPVPVVQEAGWAPEPVWTQRLEEKYFRLYQGTNIYRPVVLSEARHYTDRATRFTYKVIYY
jgi:hypothetical protein